MQTLGPIVCLDIAFMLVRFINKMAEMWCMSSRLGFCHKEKLNSLSFEILYTSWGYQTTLPSSEFWDPGRNNPNYRNWQHKTIVLASVDQEQENHRITTGAQRRDGWLNNLAAQQQWCTHQNRNENFVASWQYVFSWYDRREAPRVSRGKSIHPRNFSRGRRRRDRAIERSFSQLGQPGALDWIASKEANHIQGRSIHPWFQNEDQSKSGTSKYS